MAVFDFPFHVAPAVQYPDDQTKVKLGRGWTHVAKPFGPIERVLKLKMRGMQFFLNGSNQLDASVNPQRNAYALEQFYETHRLHGEFTYPWDGRGNLTVRFNKPLQLPEPLGNGVLPDFEIELIEVPQ